MKTITFDPSVTHSHEHTDGGPCRVLVERMSDAEICARLRDQSSPHPHTTAFLLAVADRIEAMGRASCTICQGTGKVLVYADGDRRLLF